MMEVPFMAKIKFTADSTCDLSAELLSALNSIS